MHVSSRCLILLLQVSLQVTEATTAEAVPTPTPDVDVDIDGATAEIPFIPASQRQTTSKPEIIDDTIVVVGQRQKKRKRAAAAAAKKADVDGEKSTAKPKAEVVPFDFASASNVLDDDGVPEQEDGRARKRKRQKRGVLGACVVAPSLLRTESGTDVGAV
jgi:exosome complex exonuclease RRP6